jgi:hypothetical protein
MRYGASFFSNRFPAFMIKNVALRPRLIGITYRLSARKNAAKEFDGVGLSDRINAEIETWCRNDLRTLMDTMITTSTLDLLNQRVNLPVYHVVAASDQTLDHHVVEQHLNIVYDKVSVVHTKYAGSSAVMAADLKAATTYIPTQLKRALARRPG